MGEKLKSISQFSQIIINTMLVKMHRTYHKTHTKSICFVIDPQSLEFVYRFYVLELPDRANQRRVSCIPEGTYQVTRHNSPTFGDCFLVNDVPNRSEILIHAGNTTDDTQGCLLPGRSHRSTQVLESRAAMKQLLQYAPKGFTLQVSKL